MPERNKCYWCKQRSFAFTEARAVGIYRGKLRHLLLRFKFKGMWQLAQPLAALLAWQIKRRPFAFLPQAIVSVPLSPQKERKRGYNQASLLAQSLAVRLQLPCYSQALHKTSDTLPQTRLKHKARRENLRHAFALNDSDYARKLEHKTVLLVDDVLTTGTTSHECAAVLRREAKVTRVCVAAVARAVPQAWCDQDFTARG
jgi:ComF family protein